jgi:predicted AlkP superfamily pyrophosphatase or phosphodiesterase
LPNLVRLRDDGAHASGVEAVRPSVTYPSHATIVTGVSPARHGILYNKPFDPLGRNGDGWYWYAEDIRVPTLWDAAARAGLRTSSVDWPVTVGANIALNIVQYGHPADARHTDEPKLFRALSSRSLLAEAEHALGSYPMSAAGAIDDDERRAAFSVYLLESKQPRLHFAYFSSLDEAEHRGGPGSDAARRTLERLDRVVGRLRDAARKAAGHEPVVAVVSDHGFTRTTRELDLNEALHRESLLQLDAQGHVHGWRAFTWGQGGAASIVLRDPRDDDARGRVRKLLARLDTADGPFDRVTELPADGPGGSPRAAFEISLRADARLVDQRGGFVLRAAAAAGDHGHDPRRHEMDAAFIIAGPGIPRGADLGRIDMRDIAPTLAARLGVALPDAEGRDLFGATVADGRR